MQRRLWWAALFAVSMSMAVLTAHASGTGASGQAPRYAISLDQTTQAVFLAHPELAGGSIELTALIYAREAAPQLLVGSVEHEVAPGSGSAAAPRTLRLRLHCVSQNICLPFYVLVHLKSAELKAGASSAALVLPGQHVAPGGAASSESATQTVAKSILPAGGRALLQIDSGRLHLRLPVTCLQGGSAGSTIRVRAVGRSVMYQARIVDRSTVQGSL